MNQTKKRLTDVISYAAQQRIIEEHRKRFPNFPTSYMPPLRGNFKTTDRFFYSKILEYWIVRILRWRGWKDVHKVDNRGRVVIKKYKITDVIGRTRVLTENIYVPNKTITKGEADITARLELLLWKIEIKVGNDKQSEEQKKYQAEIELDGHIYTIVRNMDDFFNELEKVEQKARELTKRALL